MQPNIQPLPPTTTGSPDIATIQKANKLKTTWALICLVSPTALLVITILVYAMMSFFLGQQEANTVASDSLFPESPLHTVGNILLFIVGAIGAATFLPGIIIGIVLLATRQRL